MDVEKLWGQLNKLFLFIENSKNISQPEFIEDAEKIIEIRSELRNNISDIQEICDALYGSKISYYLVFPLVIYSDEIMSRFFDSLGIEWPKMQMEIYKIEDGGEKYFEILDQVIEQPTYPEIVYQIFVLILKTEYKGKLVDIDKKNRKYYLEKLEKLLKNSTLKPDEQISSRPNQIIYNKKEQIKDFLSRHFYLPCTFSLLMIYLISYFILTL